MNKPTQQPKITIVPPNPAPKRLTANSAIRSLRDHALAFWNAANPFGAKPEKQAMPPAIAVPVKPTARAGINWAAIAKTMNADKQMRDNFIQGCGEALTAGSIRKHICGMRTNLAFTMITNSHPHSDSEYLARRKALMSEPTDGATS